jgi:uncharacterized protein YjiS (DUF1127 family)
MKHASFPPVSVRVSADAEGRINKRIFFAEYFHLLTHGPLSILVTWFERVRLRAELVADLRDRPEYLRDIGICEHAAQFEATRFFWEPVLLSRTEFDSTQDAGEPRKRAKRVTAPTSVSLKY